MLSLEIKVWLILTFILIIIPLFWILFRFFKVLINLLGIVYSKYKSKRNLEEIKNQVLNGNNDKAKEITKKEERIDVDERLKLKLNRIKIQALALKEKGDLDGYEKKLLEGLAFLPDHFEFLDRLADLYFSLGKYNKALPILKKVLQIKENYDKAVWQLGKIYLDKGDYETALLLIQKAVKLNPKNPKYYVTLAEIYYSMEDIDNAIKVMKKCYHLRPGNTAYILSIATLYEEKGDLDNAKKYYFKVLEYDPTNEYAKQKINEL